jgi:hypothetical protein
MAANFARLTLEEKRAFYAAICKVQDIAPRDLSALDEAAESDCLDALLGRAPVARPAPGPALSAEADSTTGALVAYFAKQERDKREPWRVTSDDHAQRLQTYAAQTLEFRQRTMLSRAKAKLLTRDDVMGMTFWLHGSEATRAVYCSIVLAIADQAERIRHHNWFVAQAMGEEWLSQHGKAVARLQEPLFPPVHGYEQLNAQLLNDASLSGTVTGGSYFLERKGAAPKAAPKKDGPVTGGATAQGGHPMVPVHADPHGVPYVDLQNVSDAFSQRDALQQHTTAQFDTVLKRLAVVEKELATYKRPGKHHQPASTPQADPSTGRGGRGLGGRGNPAGFPFRGARGGGQSPTDADPEQGF